MEKMLIRLQKVLHHQPVILDYLHFVLNYEMGLVDSFANVIELPQDVCALSDVLRLMYSQEEERPPASGRDSGWW